MLKVPFTLCLLAIMLSADNFCRQIGPRPIKKISVFRVTGLKILGRVGTHIFFLEKKYN